jgi:DNA adenine methylase
MVQINNNINIPKPILKWVGGKTQILDKIMNDVPTEMNNYHEIFLGGGSVLFTILAYLQAGDININKVYAYDLNEPLISVYKNIQSCHNELYDHLLTIVNQYRECGDGIINRKPTNIDEATIAKENYYYWIRQQYNHLSSEEKNGIIGSAMFIFLNKTCFRGMFRVGPRGFNVPYGHYKNPEIINKSHLDQVHDLIKDVIFQCCDYSHSLSLVQPNDFVYIDPPYAPENRTSFVGYTKEGFNLEHHISLFNLIHGLTDINTKIILSNADVELVRDHFTNEKYNTISILCKRSINSKNPDAKAKEVIIRNY